MSRPDIQPEPSHRAVFRPTATLLDKLYRFQSSLRLGSPTIFVGNTTRLWYASEDYKYNQELLPKHNLCCEIWGLHLWLVQDSYRCTSRWYLVSSALRAGHWLCNESSSWQRQQGLNSTPRRSSRYPAEKLADLDYADDIALFEAFEAAMAETTEAIRNIAGKLGLQMSYKKTEILPIGSATTSNPVVPLGDEGNFKVVDHFKYLGAYCSADGSNTKELNNRIGKASAAFRELDKVWKDRNISLTTKMKLYTACVLSTLLYAAECWTLTERDEARLDAFDMRCQRKILKIVWFQHISNDNIRSRTKQPHNIITHNISHQKKTFEVV